VDQGADLIDLGAVSTAPGSPEISESLELERLLPALAALKNGMKVPISVDP
jgi:dihydropteroate synthase